MQVGFDKCSRECGLGAQDLLHSLIDWGSESFGEYAFDDFC